MATMLNLTLYTGCYARTRARARKTRACSYVCSDPPLSLYFRIGLLYCISTKSLIDSFFYIQLIFLDISYNQPSPPFLFFSRLSVPLLFLSTPSFYPLVPLPSPGLATLFPGLSPFSCHSPITLARIQTSSCILLLLTFIGTSRIIHPVKLS